MNSDKKQLLKTLALCFVGLIMFGTTGVLLVFDIVEKSAVQDKILYGTLSGVLSLLCIVAAAITGYLYYAKHVRPVKHPDLPKSDYDFEREAEVHRRLPGKDMHEVIRNYRRKNYRNRVIAISFCCVLLVAIFLVKMTGEDHIDWRISVGVGVLTIILTFVLAGRKEFSYSSELDFRKAIAESGADPVRLNADFMMGSHFYLKDGLVVLGRDYLVIFAKSSCEVTDVSKITRITKESLWQTIQGSKLTIYRIKVTLNNGSWLRFTLRDEKEADLMLKDIRLLSIPYEILPEQEISTKKAKGLRTK